MKSILDESVFYPGLRHVVIPFSVLIDEHWVHGREKHRMPPFLDAFPTPDQS